MDQELQDLSRIVVAAARAELLPRFAAVGAERKRDGSIVTAADKAMQARLVDALAQRWPAVALLGEEMEEAEQARLWREAAGPGLWCVDPLDGTSNFAAGLPFFAVSVALVREHRVQLALVYDPMRDECFSARVGVGAWLDGEPLGQRRPHTPLQRGIAVVDLKRLDKELAVRLVREPPFASMRNLGASALEWCVLAAGRCHVYLHGRQKPWDYAAGSLILAEAGGHSCAFDGGPVFRGDPESRAVLAALDRDLFHAWRRWVGV